MKRYIFYVVIAGGFMLSASSCKKQVLVEEEIKPTDTAFVHPPYPDPVVSSTGTIVGKVMPETKFALTLYNDSHSYGEYTIVNRTGAFLMNKIEAGTYTLLVQPYDAAFHSLEISKISVDSGRTANLGLIFLP